MSTSSAPARATMTPSIVVVALTLLLGIQPVATDLYLPSLPSMVTALGTSVSAAQLTLSALIIAFGLGQLVCGPLADRFGRRPVLLTGLALFCAASLAATLAPDIGWLVAMRVLQGAAMSAAVTCGRTVIRDLFEPHEGARVMSRALTGLGCIAIASPVVGSLTVAWISWRASLAATGLFSLCALVFCVLKFEETVPIRNPHATRPGPLWRTWSVIVSNPTFRAYASLGAVTYVGLFLILVGSSFVYINVLGMSRFAYGTIMMFNAIAYTLGTILCRRLLTRHGLRGTVARAGALSVASGLTVALLGLFGLTNVWAVAVPLWFYGVAHGVLQPCSQSGAIGPFPKAAGTASALSGFTMMAAAFAAGLVYSGLSKTSVYPLTLGVALASVFVATIAWTLVQRHGEPRPLPVVVPEPA